MPGATLTVSLLRRRLARVDASWSLKGLVRPLDRIRKARSSTTTLARWVALRFAMQPASAQGPKLSDIMLSDNIKH